MKRSFWLILILLAAFKIALIQAIPLSAISYNIHDDSLFIQQAGGFGVWLADLFGMNGALVDLNINLPRGGWLGPYNEILLCKGPVYGIWIASCLLAGIPLLTAQQILYIAAGIMVIMALKQEISSRSLLLILFAFYLFNPEFIFRVLRAGIYPALSVLVLSGLFGIFSNRHEHWKKLATWILFFSCILPFFWMTREEGIWMMPSVIVTLIATLISVYYRLGLSRQLFLKAFLICIPFLFLFGSTHIISLLNSHYYGIKCVIELKSDSFRSGYGALLRIKHKAVPHIVVPSSVRQKLYAVSPTFQELEPLLEGEMGKMWQEHGCQVYPDTCGEIGAGWFMWAFREAVTLTGHHSTGQEAARYYKQLAKEINTACDAKLLPCLPERKALMPPLTLSNSLKIIQNMPVGLAYILRFKDLPEQLDEPFYSMGNREHLIYYQDMTHEKLAPTRDGTFQTSPPLPIQTMLNKIKLNILKKIASLYRMSTTILFSLAMFFYFLSLINSFRKRQLHPLTLFSTLLILGISSRLFILSFIDVTSFPGFNHAYLSPLYSFVILFICLSYINFFQLISKRRFSPEIHSPEPLIPPVATR